MLRVYLGDNHGNVGRPTVCGVVGNHRALMLCISLFQCLNFFLFHINGREHKVHLRCDFLNIVGRIHYDKFLCGFRHRRINFPSIAYCLFIGFSCTSGTGCHNLQFKPRVLVNQGDKTLSDHAGTANHTYAIFLHGDHPFNGTSFRKL